MTSVSRRGFVAGAAVASVAAAALRPSGMAQSGNAVLLYDPGLGAGARFADHAQRLGWQAQRLEGDRVRLLQTLLAAEPTALFGVSRHADEYLASEVAGQAGYRRLSLIQHRATGDIIPSCAPEGVAIATLARLAGGRWPEAFAELAIGGIERCDPVSLTAPSEPAFSWVLLRG